MKIVQILIKST